MEGEPGNSEISFLTIPSHSKHLMSSGREFQSVSALLKDLNEKKNGNTSFENDSDETENLSVSDDEILGKPITPNEIHEHISKLN